MSNKLVAVLSEPRSGSSMTMYILETVFGEKKILKGFNGWSGILKDATEDQLEKFKSFNKLGYFECKETFSGITKMPSGLVKGFNFFKLMIRNTIGSDMSLIDRCIVIIRNPKSTVVSQKELSDFFDNINETELDPYDLFFEDYIKYMSILKKLIENEKINYTMFDYDQICADPTTELARMQDFLGSGDFSKALEIPKQIVQDTSALDEYESPLVEQALTLYQDIKSTYIGQPDTVDTYII